jgi:hypothetical protein
LTLVLLFSSILSLIESFTVDVFSSLLPALLQRVARGLSCGTGEREHTLAISGEGL